MAKLGKENLIKFLQTSAGENVLRTSAKMVSRKIISAAQYYIGVPDGEFFTEKDFEESVVKAKKAYVTLNTIMGGETAEKDRFDEGKKQVPGLLTPLGVRKMVHLYTYLYCYGSGINRTTELATVRACRQSEISEGETVIDALTSTTKLSTEEIMQLGYGNKNHLAICCYKIHDKAAVFDMEELGKNYPKPEEKEVLLLTGSRLVAHCLGYNDTYRGKDGEPALMYEVEVYPPDFSNIEGNTEEIEKIVYNVQYISEIKDFYTELNTKENFPEVPACYKEWKDAFKKLVFLELKKLA